MASPPLFISLLSITLSLLVAAVVIHQALSLRKWKQQQRTRRVSVFDAEMERIEQLYADTPEEAELHKSEARIYRSIMDQLGKNGSIKAVLLNPDYMAHYTDVVNRRRLRLGYPKVKKMSMFCGVPIVESDTVAYADYLLEIGCDD